VRGIWGRMAFAWHLSGSSPVACGIRRSSANNRRVYVLRDDRAFVGVSSIGGQSHLWAFANGDDARKTLREIREFRDAEGRWPTVRELPSRLRPGQGGQPREDGAEFTQVSLHDLETEDVPLKVLKDYAHARGLAVELVEERRVVMMRPRPTYKQYRPYLEALVREDP
jgi:hypothetical protein